MSDTFIKIIQDVRTNLNGTVLGAKVGHVAGNLVEVKVFSLGTSGGDRASLWSRLLTVVPGEPYKSLEPYTIKDSYKFFGRDTEIVDVVRKIIADGRRLLVIYGRAGVGKTSLFDAGIAPLLIQKGARILSLSNYSNPVETIRQALKASEFDSNEATSIDSEVDDVTKVDAVAATVAPAHQQTTDLAKLIGDVKIKAGTLFLVLDQFELFFQPSITKDQRGVFIKDLNELFNLLPSDALKVIIVARDEPEVKAAVAELQKELPDLLESIVNVPLLNIDEAEKAINLPLEIGGDRVLFASRDVVKELSLDLASLDADETGVYPPHLQIVCRWLYDEAIKKSPFHITVDLLNRGKRSAGIAARFLELRLENQLSNAKSQALELLTQIASPGSMDWVSPNDLTLKDQPAESLRERVVELLEQMIRARLLYRHYVNGKVRYGFIDAGMADRVSMLAGPEIAEQHRAGKELQRIWQAWLARDVFATSEQLDYMSKYGSSLRLPAVRILFLLRSAIEHNESTSHWLELLRTEEGNALVLMLESGTILKDTPPPSPTDLQFASELLTASEIDASGNQNGSSPRFKSISDSAANATRNSVRGTAALALMSVDVGSAVGQIDSAIGTVDGWARRLKRISLRSAMVEADPRMKGTNSDLGWFVQLLIFLWVLRAKAYRDPSRILRIMAFGAICSGLLVGAWGAVVAISINDNPSSDFYMRFTNGAFLGGFLALGLAMIRPLLLTHAVTGQFTGSAARAVFILCPIIFGTIHLANHLFLGIGGLSTWDRSVLTGIAFLFATGISLAMKNDLDSEGLINIKWDGRYILGAAIIFFLVHCVFIVLAKSNGKALHLNFVNSGEVFASHQDRLGWLVDKVFVGGTTQSLIDGKVPRVYNLVSATDATVTGILLVFGLKLGARLNMLSTQTVNSLLGR
jgi:hypothetical protein